MPQTVAFQNLTLCRSCRATNRIPAKHLADKGRCGSCKAPLGPADEPIEADSGNLLPIMDFWAPWCGPCLAAAPDVKLLAKEMAGRALILKVDTRAHPELAELYQIRSIPHFVVFRGGKQFTQSSWVAPRSEMRLWLERAGARMD